MRSKMLGRVSAAEVRDVLLMACACGFGQSWVLISFHSLNLYASVSEMEFVLDTVYLISIVCLSILLLCMGIFQRWFGKLLEHKPVFWLSMTCMVISSVLFALATEPGPIGLGFIIFGGVLSALSSGIMLAFQGMIISRMPLRDVTIAVALGIVLGLLTFVLSILMDPIMCMVFDAMLAIAYGVCLHFTDYNLRHYGQVKVVPLRKQITIKNDDERHSVMELLTRLCVCVGLIGFVYELSRTIYIQIDIVGAGMSNYAGLQTAGAIITTAGAVLVALAMMSSQVQRMPFLCHHFLFLFLIIAALALPIPILAPGHSTFISYSLGQGAQNCFSLFMWIMTAAFCQRMSMMRLRIFCFIRFTWALGPLTGMLVGRYVCAVIGITPLCVFLLMAANVICVIVAMALVFNEHALQNAMGIIPIERRERFQEQCRRVVEKYGLSEREGEIMTMFAKGRNLAFIQDELCISKSTVSTHRQHIYKKLDIHSQQELLDLVQAVKV